MDRPDAGDHPSPGPSPGGIWDSVARAVRTEAAPEHDGVWDGIRDRVDPGRYRPRLAADVEIREFHLRWGNDYAMLANPRDLIHYRLDPSELRIARLLDGTRTVNEIVVENLSASGTLDTEGTTDLIRSLHEGGFLDPPFVDLYAALERARQPSRLRTKAATFLRTLSIEWTGADRLVRWLYRYGLRWFFTVPAVVLGAAVSVAGLVAFGMVVAEDRFSLTTQALALEFLILMGLNYLLTFLHELGHAAVLTHHGRRVKSAGFMIYYGSPAFFVDASDALMLDRRARIVQAWAGPFAELMVAGAASLAILAFPGAPVAGVLYKFAVLNYFVLFMNLIPLLELDGYFILSDLIQVPDLRPRSLSFIRHDLWHKLRIRERFSRTEVGLAVYGIVGVAFAAFSLYTGFFFWQRIFGTLLVRMWEQSVVTRALLVVLALLVAGPIVRGLLAVFRSAMRAARARWREVRFRLERGWRVEAAELIDSLPLFEDVPVDVLDEIAGRVRLRTVARGQPVVRQGERPEAFYVVRSGSVAIVEEDPDRGFERTLSTLRRGQSFGELALLEGSPRRATARALEPSELFEVDKGTFDELLAPIARSPEFAPTLQAALELRALPSFAGLTPAALAELTEHGEWITIPPGRAILEEGEAGDAFYAIGSGQVEVIRDGRVVGVLGAGDFFGEVALLLDVPRTATVRNRTPVRAYRLRREGFDRLVRDAFRRGTLIPNVPAGREQRH